MQLAGKMQLCCKQLGLRLVEVLGIELTFWKRCGKKMKQGDAQGDWSYCVWSSVFEARLKQEGDRKALLGKETGKEEARGDYEHKQTGEETQVGLESRTKSTCGTYWGPKKWHKLSESVYNQKTHHVLKNTEGRTRNLVRRLKSGARKCKEQNQMLKCRTLGPCVCTSSLLPSTHVGPGGTGRWQYWWRKGLLLQNLQVLYPVGHDLPTSRSLALRP